MLAGQTRSSVYHFPLLMALIYFIDSHFRIALSHVFRAFLLYLPYFGGPLHGKVRKLVDFMRAPFELAAELFVLFYFSTTFHST